MELSGDKGSFPDEAEDTPCSAAIASANGASPSATYAHSGQGDGIQFTFERPPSSRPSEDKLNKSCLTLSGYLFMLMADANHWANYRFHLRLLFLATGV
jgi:hypothetical protein